MTPRRYPNTPVGRVAEWAAAYRQRGVPAAPPGRDNEPTPLELVHTIWVDGRAVTLHLKDLEALAPWVPLVWPPRPLIPHGFTPADINTGASLPCCDQPADSPIHTTVEVSDVD